VIFRRGWLAAVCLTLVPLEALGARIEFLATQDGARVEGAEVCFFPGDPHHQLRSYFQNPEVRCLPADQVISLPVGHWHFFARYGTSLISDWPGFISVIEEQPESYKAVRVHLTGAGSLSSGSLIARLRDGQQLVTYFPGSGREQLPFLIPYSPDGEHFTAPAGRPFYPIIVERGNPVWIGRLHEVRAGDRIELSVDPLAERMVVAWMQFDRAAIRRWGPPDTVPQPPQVALRAESGARFPSVFPIRHFGDPDLIFIPTVPEGSLEIVAEGTGWKSYSRSVEITAAPVTVLGEPLTAVLLGAVSATWSVDESWLQPIDACQEQAQLAGWQIEVITCDSDPSRMPRLAFPRDCRRIKGVQIEPSIEGRTEIDGLSEGRYWLRLSAGNTTPWYQELSLVAGQRLQVRLEPSYGSISGRVTREGSPVAAQLTFIGGVANSDPLTGYYRAWLSHDQGIRAVRVLPCDSAIPFLDQPEHELRAGDVHDIDLLAEPFRVTVVDDATSLPIFGAECLLRFSPGSTPISTMPLQGTDERGSVTVPMSSRSYEALRRSRPAVCCKQAEYEEACADVAARSRDVLVPLERKGVRRGRVESTTEIRGGRLTWVSPMSGVTERVQVQPDGRFVYERDHEADEYLVFVSVNQPLRVADQRFTGDLLIVPLPSAPIREVTLYPHEGIRESVMIALSVGGKIVPQASFAFHQAMRGNQPDLRPDQPLHVRDIFATAELALMVGYSASQVPPSVDGGSVDYFLLPEHRRLFKVIHVGAASEVRTGD
jgi:hypothetical protein